MSVPTATIGIIIIWASTPLAIKWSGEEVGFLFALASRMTIGTALALVMVALLRSGLPLQRQARLSYIVGGLGLYSAMTAVYWGAQFIPSGLVSVVFGLNPLITSLMMAAWMGERCLSPLKLLGLALGLAGLLVVFGAGVDLGEWAWMGVLGVLLATSFHAASAVWVKHLASGVAASSITAGSLLVALPCYLLTWWLADGSWPEEITLRTGGAILYLAVFGSVLGFMLYYYALKNLGAARTSLFTLITPVLALLLGQWLNGETPSMRVWGGSALILAGLAAHQWRALSALYPGFSGCRRPQSEEV